MHTYRSDVVGSLLRPAYLKEARKRYEAGESSPAEFKTIEDQAVNEAIALQIRAGVDVISDGEMRRYAFFGHLIEAVEGFDKFGGWAMRFRDEQGGELLYRRPLVISRLRRQRHLCAEEFTYLRARTDRPTKATLISAQQAASYYDAEKSKRAYATLDAYLARSRYLPSVVSTRTTSPVSMNWGTWIRRPVSRVAGLPLFDAVAPFMPGGVSTTLRSTVIGSSTPTGRCS